MVEKAGWNCASDAIPALTISAELLVGYHFRRHVLSHATTRS